ncbi:MAG: hypothetical protein ACREIT_06025 [Tepidisphaeraceae bacterium]
MRNSECGMRNGGLRQRRWRRVVAVICCSAFSITSSAFPAFAGPTQEDVFKSISESVGKPADSNRMLAVLLGGVAVIALLAIVAQRRKRAVRPKALNHPGKLMKEIGKSINLKPAQVKQLKTLAEQKQLASPVTLLLCPSLLGKSTGPRPARSTPSE